MSVLSTYAVGLSLLAGLAVAWGAIQSVWRRHLPAGRHDGDALAGRFGCLGCSAAPHCPPTPGGAPCAAQEES